MRQKGGVPNVATPQRVLARIARGFRPLRSLAARSQIVAVLGTTFRVHLIGRPLGVHLCIAAKRGLRSDLGGNEVGNGVLEGSGLEPVE